MSTKLNNFDVLKAIGEANGKLWLTPLSNISNMRKTKLGTQATIGIGMDIIAGVLNGDYVGGLILADAKEFEAMAAKLETEALERKKEETFTDESGTVWERPTAWAYAQACKTIERQRAALEHKT